MQTRAELYEFLGYHAYEQKLDALFAEPGDDASISRQRSVRSRRRVRRRRIEMPLELQNRRTPPKPKKSVALSGVVAGNTALCTVGRTGNDLHYRGYDILDIADVCEFEEIAYLLVHGKLPNVAELAAYKDEAAIAARPADIRCAPRSKRCPPARIRWT